MAQFLLHDFRMGLRDEGPGVGIKGGQRLSSGARRIACGTGRKKGREGRRRSGERLSKKSLWAFK